MLPGILDFKASGFGTKTVYDVINKLYTSTLRKCVSRLTPGRGAKEVLPYKCYVADDKLVAVMQVDDVVISVHWHVDTLASAIPGVWITAL